MSKRKRRPASACAQCGETLESIGGRRVIGTADRGVLVCGPEMTLGELHPPASIFKMVGAEYVVTYGAGWTEEAELRAFEAGLDGLRPWICQKCAGRTCTKCGAPLENPITSSLLSDDGTVSHLMIVPARNSCINPQCSDAVARLPATPRKR